MAYYLHRPLKPYQKLLAFKDKFLEVIDQYKDIVYLYGFEHTKIALLILIHSITYPFALFCQQQIG